MNPLKKLPTIIEDVASYHYFKHMEAFLREVFGDENFHVEEAGFYNNAYVGVVYYGEKTKEAEVLFKQIKSESAKWSLMTD